MAELEIAFRLPADGWPRVLFRSNYSYGGAELWCGGQSVARAQGRAELEAGVEGPLGDGGTVSARLVTVDGAPRVEVKLDGVEALREDALRAAPTRTAWLHALIALSASAAGFIASYLYLRKAHRFADPWALKMAYHMAAWHLLLTFTLFPVSVWGQRTGIRVVQIVSFVFFAIHAGIAIANAGTPDLAIAVLNATSGVLFLVATGYGQRAWRDMDPVAALLRHGPPPSAA